MPPSLRKACHACVLAKRRCRPQLPQCSRCLKNGVECTYDLEPLTVAEKPIEWANAQETPPNLSDLQPQASYSVFDNVASAHQAAIQSFQLQNQGLNTPELRIVADKDVLLWAVSQLAQIPEFIIQKQSSPFVHAQLYLVGSESTARMEHVLKLHEIISREAPDQVIRPSQNVQLQQLTSINIQGLPLNDVLTYLHELVLYLVIYSCNNLPSCYISEAQRHVDLLIDWTEHLWTAIREQSSERRSPWQGWLVAESARRSMIACYLIKGAISILRSGYSVYLPFLESLPFDPRTGLWEAMSEDAWQSTVTKHGGQPEVLMSFREFIESSEDLSHIKDEGMFQRFLLSAYYGKRALKELESV